VVASRWQRVGYLIGSGFESHTSRTRSERLTTCAIRPVVIQLLPEILNFLLNVIVFFQVINPNVNNTVLYSTLIGL